MPERNLTVESFRNSTTAARFLQSGLSVNSLRTNGLLRKQEWQELDTRLVQVARPRLVGIADLQARGLVLPLGGLGTLISQYEAASDMTGADISMDGMKQGEKDTQAFDLRSVPIPIVHKDFSLNIRRLEASRRLGDALDTTQGQVAARRVADKLESILFNGAGISVDGNPIYGYTNHPSRNTGTAPGGWGNINNIYDTVLNMISDARADKMYGPFMLYVSDAEWTHLLKVYADSTGQTALARMKNIPNLEDIKPSNDLAAGNAVLVQMTSDVVDLAVAQDIVTIEWNENGGMVSNFKVMAVMAPRVKSDYDGRSGIVHYTGLEGS